MKRAAVSLLLVAGCTPAGSSIPRPELELRDVLGSWHKPASELDRIGHLPADEALPLLRELLHDRRPRVRDRALVLVGALGTRGRAAAPDVDALGADPNCRARALHVLGLIAAPQALDRLAGLLIVGRERPRDPLSREDQVAAIQGLIALREPKAKPLFRRLLESGEPVDIRAWSAHALLELEPRDREARSYLESLRGKDVFHEPALERWLAR